MADLTREQKLLVSDQLIKVIKKNGEFVSEGYRIQFSEMLSCLNENGLNTGYGEFIITESNIFGFFRERADSSDMKIGLRADGSIHWLYLTPSRTILLSEIKTKAQQVVESLKQDKGTDASGHFCISAKKLSEELSDRIVFFEYVLRKNNVTPKEFLKQLSAEQIARNLDIVKEQKPAPVEVHQPEISTIVENIKTMPTEAEEDGREYTDNDVWQDIVKIVQEKSSDGSNQIVLGVLSTSLANESSAYRYVKNKYKGIVRKFLEDKFRHLLKIEYIDGKDVVVLTEAEHQEQVSTKEASEIEKQNVDSQVQQATKKPKKKSTKRNQLEEQISLLSTDELQQFQLLVQFIFSYCGNKISGAVSRLSKKAKEDEEKSYLSKTIGNIEINVLATLFRNEKENGKIFDNDVEDILEAIQTELNTRGVASEGTMLTAFPRFTLQDPGKTISDADYEGLDDWLPF